MLHSLESAGSGLLLAFSFDIENVSPQRLVLITVLNTIFTVALCSRLFYSLELERGLRPALANALQKLPFVSSYVHRLQRKVVTELEGEKGGRSRSKIRTTLPQTGLSFDALLAKCERLKQEAPSLHTERMSGAIYVSPASEAFKLCTSIYSMFAHTNPLHGDAFPTICAMEADVVSFVACLLGAKNDDDICGNLTSGGTESILSAIRTSRDYMRATRGINEPEMIAAVSAHAAIYKAAEYFNIKLMLIGTDEQGRLNISELKRKMNKNVILVYASAPGYPHGVIDSVEAIASCVRLWGCCLHVDACLGGFVLPFAGSTSGKVSPYPKYHFEVPEVTSMSIDTHKYGCAQKGSSVILYRNRQIRKFQYTAVSSWTGGMYISPSQAGSRSGGIIAQTWAIMMYFGHAGYSRQANNILQASASLRRSIADISPLELIGEDVTMVVAWRSASKEVDIYVLNDILAEMGWHLSVLHSPPALHMCITSANIPSLQSLVVDLHEAVGRVKSGDFEVKNAKAPIYGMANRMSDTNIVNDLLKDIQDVMDK